MKYEHLKVQQKQAIAWLIIHRPKKRNALNRATLVELHQALVALEQDARVRVVALTGSGDKAFVAGADIAELADLTPEEAKDLVLEGNRTVFDYIENYSKPVIAAVNGYALGGGLELAMACHVRVFADTARVGMPETSLGLIPGYGGTQRLPQLVGKGRAMKLLLTASMVDAQRAYEIGLANRVCSSSELNKTVEILASQIIENAPQAQTQLIGAVNAGYETQTDGYAAEAEAFGTCFGTENFREGTQSFLRKRKPKY